jgi:hypothetical protein
MMPKVGQLLRWYDNFDNLEENNDIGVVKEVQFEGTNFFDNDEYEYIVVIDWCKGPHHSLHDQAEYEESVRTNEIVVV